MRAAFIAALILFALGAPLAAADGEDQWIYLEATGHLAVGLLGVGVEPVNQATHVVTPVDGFHKLRLRFDFTPDHIGVDTPAAEAALKYQFRVIIFDNATGDILEDRTLRGSAAMSYLAPDESPIRIELTMTQGANVTYDLRVSALRDPVPL